MAESICLLSILAVDAGGCARFGSKPGQARAAKADVANICRAMKQFRADVGRYPTTEEGLSALIHAPPHLPKWNGPYIEELGKEPKDPWGRPYVYNTRDGGEAFEVRSLGRDGKAGTEDDIAGS